MVSHFFPGFQADASMNPEPDRPTAAPPGTTQDVGMTYPHVNRQSSYMYSQPHLSAGCSPPLLSQLHCPHGPGGVWTVTWS